MDKQVRLQVNLLLIIMLVIGYVNAGNPAEEGKKIAFDRKKGNCLACHAIKGGEFPGNIGPPLVAMQLRFSSKTKLREIIWDARKKNPHTIMPPYGNFRILTEDEIDKVVEYIYSL